MNDAVAVVVAVAPWTTDHRQRQLQRQRSWARINGQLHFQTQTRADQQPAVNLLRDTRLLRAWRHTRTAIGGLRVQAVTSTDGRSRSQRS